MTSPLFLADLDEPRVGDEFVLAGEEGRHAATVRRIRVDEVITVSDGAGAGIRGPVIAVDKASVTLRIEEVLHAEPPVVRYLAAQALAKGDRAELAVEVLTELGIDQIIPWQAERSIVKWTTDREGRQLGRWRSTARQATKQSRRLRVPIITAPVSTRELALLIPQTALALILHEAATDLLTSVELPSEGDVLVIIGPEGGISDAELAELEAAGARQVLVSDGVLRTSTAGVVALAQLQALERRANPAS